ncbi:unnamed protein product, partial [Phaeothamnion confervicola]
FCVKIQNIRKRICPQVLVGERVLMLTIGFDLCVPHPHRHLHAVLKAVFSARDGARPDRRRCTMRQALQAAANFATDQLRTDLCLRHPAENVAAAAVYLALRLL